MAADNSIPIAVATDLQRALHRTMCRIRLFELAIGQLGEDGKIPGAVHLSVGQEAVAAGVCAALRPDDQLTSTHRGHGHLIAKGGAFRPMLAELFGRVTGYCRGKGGSMHLSDPAIGMLGANGIVGAGIPIALGAAYANRYLGSDRLAVAFFGDGACGGGLLHETANMAALWSLPLVLVCENNGYAEFTSRGEHQAYESVADLAQAWGMPGVAVDGMDVLAVYQAMETAADRARRGDGPTLIEAVTYRYFDHVGIKGLRVPYRTEEEVERWKGRDCIESIEALMAADGTLSPTEAEAIKDEIRAEIEEAIAYAESSPVPGASDLLDDVYTEVTA